MQRLFLLFLVGLFLVPVALVGLFLVPVAADPAMGRFMCPNGHFIRAGGTETRETVYTFLNGSKIQPVTIERLTIRNAFGVVVHDSGPAIGVPHPLNTSFSPPEDITVVAPRQGVFIKTTQIWGLNPIPDLSGNPDNRQGFFGSAVVEFSAEGNDAVESFRVMAMRRIRERITRSDGSLRQGAERTTTGNYCFRIED